MLLIISSSSFLFFSISDIFDCAFCFIIGRRYWFISFNLFSNREILGVISFAVNWFFWWFSVKLLKSFLAFNISCFNLFALWSRLLIFSSTNLIVFLLFYLSLLLYLIKFHFLLLELNFLDFDNFLCFYFFY